MTYRIFAMTSLLLFTMSAATLACPILGGCVYPVGVQTKPPTFQLPNQNGYAITQGFFSKSSPTHAGVDLSNGHSGGEVRAIAAGHVVEQRETNTGFGWALRIEHTLLTGETVYSIYAHMQANSLTVGVGDSVTKGQLIGRVDSTGLSTANHLHFAIRNINNFGCGYVPSSLPQCANDTTLNYRDPLKFIVSAPSILLGTNLPTTCCGEASVSSIQFLGDQFTLTAPVQVSRINLQMSGFGTDEFTLWLTDSIGPGTTLSNVLLQINLKFPNTGGGLNGQTVSANTSLQLNPGTYFLVLSSAQSSILQGWMVATTILPSAVGTISRGFSTCCIGGSTDTSFPPASAFLSPIAILAFQIFGSTTVGEVTVTISPKTITVHSGDKVQFTATVTGATNTSVTWRAAAGTITSTGLYTAPAVSVGTIDTVLATSVADVTKSDFAQVTVLP